MVSRNDNPAPLLSFYKLTVFIFGFHHGSAPIFKKCVGVKPFTFHLYFNEAPLAAHHGCTSTTNLPALTAGSCSASCLASSAVAVL